MNHYQLGEASAAIEYSNRRRNINTHHFTHDQAVLVEDASDTQSRTLKSICKRNWVPSSWRVYR